MYIVCNILYIFFTLALGDNEELCISQWTILWDKYRQNFTFYLFFKWMLLSVEVVLVLIH